jgi:predicted kinase
MNYVENYLKTIDTPHDNTKKLFAVGLIGLVGSGKSTFARVLASKLNLYIASNDRIRRWLNGQGIDGASPEQATLQEIAEATTRFLYSNRISHIIDADLMKFQDVALDNAVNHSARLFFVEVMAPEEVILQRLRQRDAGNIDQQDLSRVGVEEYVKRKAIHEAMPRPDKLLMTIDTSQDLESQVDRLVEKLRKEGVVG